MIIDNSNAISTTVVLIGAAWTGSWSSYDIDGYFEAPYDESMATGAGRVTDLVALTHHGSGVLRRDIVKRKQVNDKAITLLRRWIEEYGDDRDPDLDEQMAELSKNRLALYERC